MAELILIHEEFNARDADVIFQSSDGVQFRLHRKNLEAVTGAFPGPEFETKGDVVELTEPADVLQILFKFIYPRKNPDLDDLDFSLVAAIAEAAEKYEVFPAINTCVARFRHYIPDHPLEILLYGTKHDHPKLIDEAAPYLFFSPTISTAEKLPPDWVFPWLKFAEETKAIIFGKARQYIELQRQTPQCQLDYQWGEERRICSGCKWSLSRWIDGLEKISSRSALFSALHNFQTYLHSDYSGCGVTCAKQCMHVSAVADVMKKGMDSIPQLTNFSRSK